MNVFEVAERKRTGSEGREATELVNLGVGADYLYHFGGRQDRGPYALAGLSLEHWAVAYSTYSTSGGTSDDSGKTTHRKTSLGGALGLGYHVNGWFGLEARYAYSTYEGAQGGVPVDGSTGSPSANRSGAFLQLAATFRW